MVRYFIIFYLIFFVLFSCDDNSDIKYISREDAIPDDAVKITPDTDLFPPILYSNDWLDPVPLAGDVNTAGGEDSPFIPIDNNTFYFFFTPDVSIPAEEQVADGATGIYQADLINAETFNVKRIVLQDDDKLALDGCPFVRGDTIWFCSAREGYTGLHWFKAERINGEWINWRLTDFNPDYAVGELHIHDDLLFYHSIRDGGKGDYDIWQSKNTNGGWASPVNLTSVNTTEMEGFPFINADGTELWFTRTYQGTPAIYRSIKTNDSWGEPELIISQFAGEPTLDADGNIYFVHHFYDNGVMLEADIYVAKKK